MRSSELSPHLRGIGIAATATGALLLGPLQPASAHEASPAPQPGLSQDIGTPPSAPTRFPDTLQTPTNSGLKEALPIPGLPRETKYAHIMPCAPQFAESTEALLVTNGDIRQVTKSLRRITAHSNPASTQVEIIGFASGEDDWKKPHAGLTTKDNRNQGLALARAEASATKLRKTIDQDPWLASVSVKVVGAKEQQLNQEHANELEKYAANQGFANLSDMIVQYNDGATSAEVTQKLNQVIGAARGVEYRIKFKSVVPPIAADHQRHANTKEPQPQPAETPVQNPPGNITESKTGHLGDLALPTTAVIGAAALLARRRSKKSTQGLTPTPEEVIPGKILTPA